MNLLQLFLDAYGQLPGQTKLILWSLVALSILIRILQLPKFKGWFGEKFVQFLFKLHLPEDEYTRFNNVTLPTEDGTTQIDHIIVSKYGIFCIETKNMRGWIYGSEKQAKWTQVIYKKKTQFQNPLRQNYKHTETLRTLLELPEGSVHSIIVFVGDSTFKTKMPLNVTYCRGCTDYILSFKGITFDEQRLQDIKKAIHTGRLEPTRATHKQHVEHLKEKFTEPQITPTETPAVPTCPKCGSPMILRTTKKGPKAGQQFWGCSTFPKCRKTLQSTA